jgi:hypothetical protein
MFDGEFPPTHLRYSPEGFIHHGRLPPRHPLVRRLDAILNELDEVCASEAAAGGHDTREDSERLIAAWLRAQRCQHFNLNGFKPDDWRGEGLPPRVDDDDDDATALDGLTVGSDFEGLRARPWMDHTYRLTHPARGTRLRSEPYQLDDECILDLANLISQGYHVDIDADGLHFPGRTVRVTVRTPVDGPQYVPPST